MNDCRQKKHESRVRLEIDLSQLKQNFEAIKQRAANCDVLAVLKANAYGLGVEPVAGALKASGATRIGVAELNEALQLLHLNLPVQILGNLLPGEVECAVASDVVCPVTGLEMARILDAEGARQHRKVVVHLIVDSGMGRLGMLMDRAIPEILEIKKLPNLIVEGVYSHFPNAYVRNEAKTLHQIAAFRQLIVELEQQYGVTFRFRHFAASDAINNYPETLEAPFNLIRAGINMYGYYDNDVAETLNLTPIVSLKTRVAAIRELPAGTTLGYGRTYTLLDRRKIATIAAGYADGLPLALSNRGFVLIRGILCPIVGRLSMDYTTVDVSQLPDVAWGDEVVCFGQQGNGEIPLGNWAQLKGTHAYELLCSIGSRVERVYRNGAC